MRLPTDKELIVIDLLLNGEETYAWDLVKKSDGQLAQNGIYVILMRMVARGLLSDRLEEPVPNRAGPRRRMYKLTAEGRAARDAYYAAVEKYPRGQLARIGIGSLAVFGFSSFQAFAETSNDPWVKAGTIASNEWYKIGEYTAFTPDGGVAGYIYGESGVSPYAAAEGEWYDIAEAVPVANNTPNTSLVLLLAALVGIAYFRRDLVALLKQGVRYAGSTFAEEMYIAQTTGHTRPYGILLGLFRATCTGIVGISPFGGASADRLKNE